MKFLILLIAFLPLNSIAQETTAEKPANSSPGSALETLSSAPEALPMASQAASPLPSAPPSLVQAKEFPYFTHMAYGYMSFTQKEVFKTVQNLDPIVRRQMDLAELAFEGAYHLTDTSKVEFEIEIEHGGVGTVIEFDPFEEFGEFEQEIEKGGEITLHELYYKKTFNQDASNLKIGKFPLFISLGSVLTKPHKYATIRASDLEERMIPLGWTETGLQLEHKWKFLTARLGFVSGLNSEFFRTYSWVGGGYQRHFETMNADNLATVASIEIGEVSKGKGLAVASYTGDTTENRYKVDKLKDPAQVSILSVMANYHWGPVGISGEIIEGELENSDKVALANSTLAGIAKPKTFAPLGKKARLESLQLSYLPLKELSFYIKTENVNTFVEVAGSINKNPRYDVRRNTLGLMWMWDTAAFLKAQYAREKTQLKGLPETYQASLAFGFDLDTFK